MQRKQEMMTIVAQKQLAPRIYQLDLQGELVKEMTRPGQFVHIKVPLRLNYSQLLKNA